MKSYRSYDADIGCTGMIIFFLLFLVIFIILSLVSIFIWAGLFYLLWNFVIAPIGGLALINFFWQSIIVGTIISFVLGAFTTKINYTK